MKIVIDTFCKLYEIGVNSLWDEACIESSHYRARVPCPTPEILESNFIKHITYVLLISIVNHILKYNNYVSISISQFETSIS